MPSIHRRKFLCVLGGAAGVASFAAMRNLGSNDLQKTIRTSKALGAEVTLTVLHSSQEIANRAIDAAFSELNLIEDVMSLYRPNSEICRLNANGSLENPHPHFVQVLRAAQQMAEKSSGAFDCTVQPLWDLYVAGRSSGEEPSTSEIEDACARVDWRKVHVTEHQIEFAAKRMAITLNGIAQGFATDRVTEVLKQHGIQHALISVGEIAGLGSNNEQKPWRVGIQHPRQPDAFVEVADLQNRCLATSGDYATRFETATGQHHIFDPRTGISPDQFASISVAAPTAMQADAFSTALFVLDPETGMELVSKTPDIDVLCVFADGRTIRTKNFPVNS